MGFLTSPSPSDNACNVPHRRALGLNNTTSRANQLTDIWHATTGTYNTYRPSDSLVQANPIPFVGKSEATSLLALPGPTRLTKTLRTQTIRTSVLQGPEHLSWLLTCVATVCRCLVIDEAGLAVGELASSANLSLRALILADFVLCLFYVYIYVFPPHSSPLPRPTPPMPRTAGV